VLLKSYRVDIIYIIFFSSNIHPCAFYRVLFYFTSSSTCHGIKAKYKLSGFRIDFTVRFAEFLFFAPLHPVYMLSYFNARVSHIFRSFVKIGKKLFIYPRQSRNLHVILFTFDYSSALVFVFVRTWTIHIIIF